ncbi:threonine-phosphate decarboxylase CobD [Aneurinibacillus terranovensis]|uniref:threonine-phosphate decarboxylase CobD n=1 Tax=Aneurinibacillus terranovensis TaxID=278991 RepID=UPI0003F94443|nr:threonine-phosphate decarboxylase CobD [Aneurinibacillus terranovensis]
MSTVEKFGHGGDLTTASDLFGVRKDEWFDFSANINPLGPPVEVVERLHREMKGIIHYPDPAHRSFVRQLARKYAIDEEMLLVGNGAAECIALTILAFAPRQVGVIDPCFSEYRHLAEQFGASVSRCSVSHSAGSLPPLDGIYPLFRECDLVFIGHPNNPTGLMYTRGDLEVLAEWAEETDTWLVIDEAFLDFLSPGDQSTLLPSLHMFSRVILIRSMTKFYAIPGLRLGFSIANPTAIKKMKSRQVTWSVNSLALAAGEAALTAVDYEERSRELIARERTYLFENLCGRFGWKVWPGKANFLLVRLPYDRRADELQQRMGAKGILIRNCSMYPGLTEHDFRIAVRSREENNRFLSVLSGVIDEWTEEGDR